MPGGQRINQICRERQNRREREEGEETERSGGGEKRLQEEKV